MGVRGRGLSFTGTALAFEQNYLFERDCHPEGDDHGEKLPSTSQHQAKLFRKPPKTRRRREKPPVARTVLSSGELLGTYWEMKEKSQSGNGFCWRDLGRKRPLYAGRVISSGKEPVLTLPYKRFGNNGEENR